MSLSLVDVMPLVLPDAIGCTHLRYAEIVNL